MHFLLKVNHNLSFLASKFLTIFQFVISLNLYIFLKAFFMSIISQGITTIKTIASPLSAFLAGTGLTCCAFSLLSSILAIRMSKNGVSTSEAGLVLSLYYAGYAVASISSYRIINRAGHIRTFCAFISGFSAIVPLHYLSTNPAYWALLRLVEGYCIGTCFLCLESWLNTRSNNKNRGLIMSFYMITTYLGSSLGQLLLNLPDRTGMLIYAFVASLFSVALIPISLTALPSPDINVHKSMSLTRLYKKSPVGVVGCFASGFLVGAFYTLGAIYAKQIGLDIKQTSIFMFCGIFGGMLAQLPIGRLSDKMDRRFVLMWTSGFLFLIAPWIQNFIFESNLFLAGGAILLGSGIFVMYPICVSHVNDQIEDSERVNASGMMILLQSMGLVIGPIIISFTMQHLGNIWFMFSYSVISGLFILFTFKQIATRAVGYINFTPTDPMPVAPTHAFSELTQDDTLMDRAKDALATKH